MSSRKPSHRSAARGASPPAPGTRSRRLLLATALAIAAFVTYLPALSNGFTNYDDDVYVTGNPHVSAGLSTGGLRWALTTDRAANWHPLTWISHMADSSLWGRSPRGAHATSLILHALNVAILFLVFDAMTGETWKSAAVAALFAVHPQNVESVAWIAERKNVLSTLFWLLTMIVWIRHVRNPRPSRYTLALVFFACGLAAKPMLVTLPFVLLLLDVWPLSRFDRAANAGRLVLEKAPFFVLAAASSAITLVVQHGGRAVGSFEEYPFFERVGNALVSWVTYAIRAVWPAGLSPFYPHPGGSLPAWKVAAAAALIAAAIFAALRARERRPYLTVGFFWFLGTLVPVIGLVQVGDQGMADRYAYIPLIGLFVVLAWGIPDLAAGIFRARTEGDPRVRGACVVLSAVALPWLAVATAKQTEVWRDSFTLFGHALAVDPRNPTAHINLALAASEAGDTAKATLHYRQALAIKPDAAVANNNLGLLLSRQGSRDEAMRLYRAALDADPEYVEAHENLGIALVTLGRADEGAFHFAEAIRLAPEESSPHYNWGTALATARRFDEAITHLREAIRLHPDHAQAHANLAAALYATGELAGAWREVALARRFGYEPPPDLVRLLSEKMAEPRTP